MKIGERYSVTTKLSMDFNGPNNKKCPLIGEIIYVHPKARFAVLRFYGICGSWTESFDVDELQIKA